MITIKLSLSDVKRAIGTYGYTLEKNQDELLARPRGKNGPSIVQYDTMDNARHCLIKEVREAAVAAFRVKLEGLPINDDIKGALVAWYTSHGKDWKIELCNAWCNGNYGYTGRQGNVSGILQCFRNTNGHDVIHRIR